MTVPFSDCPPDDLLARYLDDALSPAATGPLTAHIDGCPACQTKLDAMTAGGAVSDRLKHLSALADRPPDATLDRGVTTATDTQVFGSDGIPMIPRVYVPRPQVPGYDVDAEIGRGGMGVVFRATHKRLNRVMALKMVLAAGVADPRVTQRFLFEAEVLARVQHPQVVQVYEVNMFTAPTGVVFPYLAMELLPGGTLLQWANGKPVAANEAAALVEGLARAVHAVHQQGIVHRDLKPANVLRSADGVFKVSDFGLAKLTAEPGAQLTGTGMVVGTPAYMAPEQAGGGGVIGPPADVYSLGAILFELLAGRPPFPGDDAMSVLLKVIRDPAPDVRTLRGDVPRDLAAVVMKCLTKEPARRYPSAGDLADDLKRFLNRRPTRARTLSAVERVWYWARRNPHVASLLAGLAVAITAGFVSTFILWQRAEGTAEEKRRESVRAGLLADRARKKSDEAEGERRKAEEERRKADRTTAYVLFDQAWGQCESGSTDDGLAGFVKALGLAERLGEHHLARVIRVNIASWEREQYTPGRRVVTKDGFVAFDFSPDGQRMIAADGDGVVRVSDADTAAEVCSFDTAPALMRLALTTARRTTGKRIPSPDRVHHVAVDPSGRWAAACTGTGRLVVCSLTDPKGTRGVDVTSPYGRLRGLWRVAFAGGRVWAGGDDGVLFAYDPATLTQVATITLPGVPHPNATAAVLGGPSFLHAIDLGKRDDAADESTPRRPAVLQYQSTSVMALRPSPDGTRLFVGDRNGRVTEWEADTGRLIATYPLSHTGHWVYAVAVSADGKYVAATGTGGTAYLWLRQPDNPPELWRVELGGAQGTGLALSADAGRLFVADSDGRVVGYDTRTRTQFGPPLGRAAHPHLTLRPGGDELVLNDGGELRFVRPPDPPCVPVPWLPPATRPNSRVRSLDYRPDGRGLLVCSGGLWVFDPATGRQAVALPPPDLDEPLVARFSADGKQIVYGSRHEWGLLSATTFGRVFTNPADSGYANNVPFRPTAAEAGVRVRHTVFVANRENGQKTRVVLPKGLSEYPDFGKVMSTPDGREWRVSGGEVIEFVDPVSGNPARPPLRAGGPVNTFDQTPDGKHLLVQVGEHTAQVWDAEQAKLLHATRLRHRGAVTAVALSPDAKVFLTGSRDRSALFWDAETGLVLGPRRTHTDAVTVAAYSPDGREVAVGTIGGMTLVWQVPPPPTAATLEELQTKYPGQ